MYGDVMKTLHNIEHRLLLLLTITLLLLVTIPIKVYAYGINVPRSKYRDPILGGSTIEIAWSDTPWVFSENIFETPTTTVTTVTTNITQVNKNIILLDIKDSIFFKYQGLYIVHSRDLSRIENEFTKLYLKVFKHHGSWDLYRKFVTIDKSKFVIVSESVKPLISKGVYPLWIKYSREDNAALLKISYNSTISNTSSFAELVNQLLEELSIPKNTLVLVLRIPSPDPVTEYMLKNTRVWEEIKTRMREKYGGLCGNGSSGVECGFCNDKSKWFDGLFAPAYDIPLQTAVVSISSLATLCIGIDQGLGHNITSIWGLVGNKTVYTKLARYLDGIIEGLNLVNLDHHGLIVEVKTSFTKPPLPQPRSGEDVVVTNYTRTSSGEQVLGTDLSVSLAVAVVVVVATIFTIHGFLRK